MLITRHNPNGGRSIKQNHFPLHQDRDGNFGLLIGYDRDGDKMLIKMSDATDFANQFGDGISKFKKLFKEDKPTIPLRVRLARMLLGKTHRKELYEQEEKFAGSDYR